MSTECSRTVKLAIWTGVAIALVAAVAVGGFHLYRIMRRPVHDVMIGMCKGDVIKRYGTPTGVWTYRLGERSRDELRLHLPRRLPHAGPEEVIQEYSYAYSNGDVQCFWLVKNSNGKWFVFSDCLVPAGWNY